MALFFLSESLRSRRLCVWFFNAEAIESAELRRECQFGAQLRIATEILQRSDREIF